MTSGRKWWQAHPVKATGIVVGCIALSLAVFLAGAVALTAGHLWSSPVMAAVGGFVYGAAGLLGGTLAGIGIVARISSQKGESSALRS